MIFKCKNCDGAMVFEPESQKLFCPFCDTRGEANRKEGSSITVCPTCGGELDPKEYTSSDKCPYCDNYIIYDERISGEYEPKTILPFKISRKQAIEAMERKFGDRLFTPMSFLTEKTLKNVVGRYVPFFLYDYDVDTSYDGEGTQIRTWRSGDYDYTETSYYRLIRKLHATYENVPADASGMMTDYRMDLLEPFDYQLLEDFKPDFMPGFFGEVYNAPAEEYKPRADKKVQESAEALLKKSLSGYALKEPEVREIKIEDHEPEYALLPVWEYNYEYGGMIYNFYVNGQSGKVVGKTPVSKLKVLFYSIGCAGLWTLLLAFLGAVLEMWVLDIF